LLELIIILTLALSSYIFAWTNSKSSACPLYHVAHN